MGQNSILVTAEFGIFEPERLVYVCYSVFTRMY